MGATMRPLPCSRKHAAHFSVVQRIAIGQYHVRCKLIIFRPSEILSAEISRAMSILCSLSGENWLINVTRRFLSTKRRDTESESTPTHSVEFQTISR